LAHNLGAESRTVGLSVSSDYCRKGEAMESAKIKVTIPAEWQVTKNGEQETLRKAIEKLGK
jgi:hypothetical protein